MYISHEVGCKDYDHFFRRLTQGTKNKEKQLNNMNTKGYLQQPLTTYEKGKYNKKCCCQSHCVHRESDKFIIANDEGYKQKLVKTNIFETMIEGEPEIFETSYQSLKGFNLKRP